MQPSNDKLWGLILKGRLEHTVLTVHISRLSFIRNCHKTIKTIEQDKIKRYRYNI